MTGAVSGLDWFWGCRVVGCQPYDASTPPQRWHNQKHIILHRRQGLKLEVVRKRGCPHLCSLASSNPVLWYGSRLRTTESKLCGDRSEMSRSRCKKDVRTLVSSNKLAGESTYPRNSRGQPRSTQLRVPRAPPGLANLVAGQRYIQCSTVVLRFYWLLRARRIQ